MNDDERQARIAEIRARLEAATTDVVNELAGFRDFDAEWLANKTHRQRASPGGVRETFYAAGRLSGLAETSNAPADLAYLLSELDAATARAERAEAALRNGQRIISGTLEAVVPDPCDCSDEEYCRECLAVSTLEQAFAALAAAPEARDGE